MTKNAREFVTPLSFESLSANRVTTETFDREFEFDIRHVSLAKSADAFLVAPATANFIGKFASGIADDFLSTAVMAFRGPVVIAPAMNTAMLESSANVENTKILIKRGVHFIKPGVGRLACGDDGAGRLAEPAEIVARLYKIVYPKNDFSGKTVLITAGATSENIDPVRYITNRSSGKMGAALCESVLSRGGKVILIHGRVSVSMPKNCQKVVSVETTRQLGDAVMQNLPDADIIIMAAAPCDYRLKAEFTAKQKAEKLSLELIKNADIARESGENKGDRKLVIFAAETEDLISNAKKKLLSKNADMAVANDVLKDGAGFGSDTNIVTIVTKNSVLPLDKMTKREVAEAILDQITKL
jgi:phosphopantothenoylcysteine decarboxylase/phosphopantothenate--cysteine ligase